MRKQKIQKTNYRTKNYLKNVNKQKLKVIVNFYTQEVKIKKAKIYKLENPLKANNT